MRLKGKVVVITGAKGGLGTYVTRAFLNAGASVAGVSRSTTDGDFAHAAFTAVPAEVSSGEAARSMAATVVAKFGRIDVLIHLVGGFVGGKNVEDTEEADLERMLDLNLRSAFHAIRAVLPVMGRQGWGRIVAIGSRAAADPAAGIGAYAASKAAIAALVRAVALEHKGSGITANVVTPGTMDTPANRAAMPDADPSLWVNPSHVAALLVHLVSDDAGHINGAVIPVLGAEL